MAEEQAQKQEAVKENQGPAKEASQQTKEAPQKKQPEPKKKQPEVIQKPANCMKCNKRLQRKTWYYRDGGYYCSKRCWKLFVQAAAEKQEKTKKEA